MKQTGGNESSAATLGSVRQRQVGNDFVHRADELVLVVEGTLEVEMLGKVLYPVIGKEIFIPAGVVHSVRNVGGTTAHWL